MHLLSEFRPDELAQILVSGEPFWLDLGNEAAAVPEPLMEVLDLGAPPEGVAAGVPSAPTAHSEFIALTLAAVGADGGEQPIAVLLSDRFLITAHAPGVDLDFAPERPPRGPAACFARVIGAVTATYPPVITVIDDEIEDVQEAALLADPTVLARVQALRGRVLAIRRMLVGQRDTIGRVLDEMLENDAPRAETRAIRNGYERFTRLADMVDSSRELIFAATDLYLSAASNRLGRLGERLTLFATIFFPATIVVGFFGQNFQWMTDHTQSFAAFAVLGVGVLVGTVAVVGLVLRGYLSDTS